MKTAFICNTPYQVFNLLNIHINDIEETFLDSDLFIVNRFKNAKELAQKIESCNLFSSVYLISQTGEKNKIYIRYRYSYKKCLQDFVFSNDDFLKKKYEKIFIADEMPFGIAMCLINRKAIKIAYEDGFLYYQGHFLRDKCYGKLEKIKKCFHVGKYSINFYKFYVNNKEICNSVVSDKIEQLPLMNISNKAFPIVKDIFNFKDDSVIRNKKLIFLERPFAENPKYNKIDLEDLLDYCAVENVLIKVHPRSLVKYSRYDVDYGYNMWELECILNVTSNHILVSDFSMAQVTPKMIADKEPYLIFIYKLLYNNLNEKEINSFEKQIELIRSIYKDKEKIFIPGSLEELSIKLSEIEEIK